MKKFDGGDTAAVNELGSALGGEELGLYINQLAQMAAIVQCLANDAETRAKDN